jgi:hypothetical protein
MDENPYRSPREVGESRPEPQPVWAWLGRPFQSYELVVFMVLVALTAFLVFVLLYASPQPARE